jgi:hypothetical protein
LARTAKAAAPTLSDEDVLAFADACIRIANAIADEHGYVAVRNLLRRFNARLIIRPLLVEGMLAIQPAAQSEWAVLVDSETYGITDADVERECLEYPLPGRLRFTIAHELAHSLAFRPSEFGIKLDRLVNTDGAKDAVVRAIEGITDRLTPLLLLSESALIRFFKADGVRTSASDIAHLRRISGVSRRTLIGRLRALSQVQADKVSRYSLHNLAICIGEWTGQNAVIRKSPVFARFHRNVFPEFLLNLANQDRLPAYEAFPGGSSFAACGGDLDEIQCVVPAGSPGAPGAESMTVDCSLETTERAVGTEFFIVVRRVPLALPVQKPG